MKRVAILGCGANIPSYKADYWGLNHCFLNHGDVNEQIRFMSRCTAWFELHRRAHLIRHFGLQFVRAQQTAMGVVGGPVYTWERWPNLANQVLYPKRRVERLTPHGRYHTMSFSWMIGLAILQGYEEIHLEGVDLGPMDAGEPVSGRACVEYWCGVAEGRGAHVIEHPPTTVFRTLRYIRSQQQYGFETALNVVDQ
jgi:hypothetical protein